MADETPTTEIKDTSLKTVIASAVKETIPEEKPSVVEKPVEEVKPAAEVKEGELTPDQQKYAVDLYKALSNPDAKQQRIAFEALAKAANLEIKDIETPKEIKEAKKGLVDLLKEGLGEFDFLADKLGPTLEKIIKEEVASHTNDIRETHKQNAREAEETKVNNAIESTFNQYTLNDSQKATLVKEMENLMDNFVPSAKTTHEQYFKALIRLAADNTKISLTSANTNVLTEKVIKNRNDAASRLASERGAEVKDVVRTTGFKSLKEAVRDALEQAAKK